MARRRRSRRDNRRNYRHDLTHDYYRFNYPVPSVIYPRFRRNGRGYRRYDSLSFRPRRRSGNSIIRRHERYYSTVEFIEKRIGEYPVFSRLKKYITERCKKLRDKNRRAYFGYKKVNGNRGKGNKNHDNRFKKCPGE